MWGIFSEGWTGGAGADADHLKTTEDLDGCLAAGFTFFTIDPGDYVDNRADDRQTCCELRELAGRLPAEVQPGSLRTYRPKFQHRGPPPAFDEATLLQAAVKYGRAMAHVAAMYRHLARSAGAQPFELEVSVDETEQPTTHAEHIYIASELKRLGVNWVSLAPRFVGRFEKGVDYIGDLQAFQQDVAGHAAIARALGPYKLSLHSGSDKFSIYPIAMQAAHGLVHLKTAGTSYLEALRTTAALDAGSVPRDLCLRPGALSDRSGQLSRFGGAGPRAPAGGRHRLACPAGPVRCTRNPACHLRFSAYRTVPCREAGIP